MSLLPRSGSPPETPSGALPREQLSQARLLVIDDQPVNVRLLEQLLRTGGYQNVAGTTDPREALRLITESPPDLVLLDLHMPGLDGFTMLAELAATRTATYVPVIVLTADGDRTARRRALALGANDFLTKPFDVEEVLLRTRNLLETRLLYGEIRRHNEDLQESLARRSEELDEARRTHQAVTTFLNRLHAGSTPEEVAEAISRELLGAGPFQLVSVISFVGEDHASPLALAGMTQTPAFPPLRVLPRQRVRYLRQRGEQGSWYEEWLASEDASLGREFVDADISAVLYAPIRADSEVVGILAAGLRGHASVDQLRALLAVVDDHAAIAHALLAPAISSRRREADLQKRLQDVIATRDFVPVFQPVVNLHDGSILGYEALTRFGDGMPPDLRFAEAEALGMGAALEAECLTAAVEASARLPRSGWLSVNVSPSLVLEHEKLARLIDAPSRMVVIEVTEHMPVEEYAPLRAAIRRFGGKVRVAIDDAGAGYASFRHIVELQPDYVKLDLNLVRGIDGDHSRQALATGMRYFAQKTGSTLIAEGIETERELASLRSLGVRFGQGYLLGRPGRPGSVTAAA